MSRRYTDDEKQHALNLLDANAGDASRTSQMTGIPPRTIRHWRQRQTEAWQRQQRQEWQQTETAAMPNELNQSHPIEFPVYEEGVRGWGQSSPIAEDDIAALRSLHDDMLDKAKLLVHSIQDAIDEAPLNQRVAALAQLIDRIIKLSTQLPKSPDTYQLAYDEDEDSDLEDNSFA